MRGHHLDALSLISCLLSGLPGRVPFYPEPPKRAKKCALPSCYEITKHNGGYCCADHCHEHRAILRTSNTSVCGSPLGASTQDSFVGGTMEDKR